MTEELSEELLEEIRNQAKGRPFQMIRHLGNRRIEVHYLGDYDSTIVHLGGPEKPEDLDKMLKKDLVELAHDLGIQPYGLKKDEIKAAIEEHFDG